MRQLLCDVMKLAGFVAILVGIGLFSFPLAMIVAGVVLVMVGTVTKIPTVVLSHKEDDNVR